MLRHWADEQRQEDDCRVTKGTSCNQVDRTYQEPKVNGDVGQHLVLPGTVRAEKI
jgi:hypothetical protein